MLVSAGGVLTYAWWNVAGLIEHELRSELENEGFSLTKFSMKRPRGWSVIINRISIVSDDLEIDISGLEISPASASRFELSIRINDARAALLPQEAAQPSSLSWGGVIELISENIPLIPVTGRIGRLELCEETCVEGELSWLRRDNQIEMHFEQPSSIAIAKIRPKALNFSLAGSGEFLFLLNANLRLDDKIHLTGEGRFQKGTRSFHLEEKEPVEFQVDVNSLKFEYSGHWPIDGIITNLKQDITGEIMIGASPRWKIQLADTRFFSDQPVRLEARIEYGIISSTLATNIDIHLEGPDFDSSLISLAPGLSCTVAPDISCRADNINVTGQKDIHDVRVELTEAIFKLQDNLWQGSAEADINLLENNELIFSTLLEVVANNERISASSASASFLGVGNIAVNIEHGLLTEKGQISIAVEQPATNFKGVVKYLALEDFDLLAGDITIASNLVWDIQATDPVYNLDLKILANDLDLSVDTFALERGTMNVHLVGLDTLENKSPATLSWQHIDIGVPVENLVVTFDLLVSQTEFRVSGQSLSAEIFGGHVNSEDFNYDMIRGNGAVNLELDKLELNQILALQQEDFESSGKVSGSVPVQIDEGTVSVSKGTISAIKPGGYIRYKPGQAVVNMLTGNDQLKVVVETMEDFQYDKLEAELEYSPEGQLVAYTSLQGNNPAFENGRKIHLNLKLEENIAALLESLRLGDELTRKIGEKNSGVKQ